MMNLKKLKLIMKEISCSNIGDVIQIDKSKLNELQSIAEELIFRIPSEITEYIIYSKFPYDNEVFELCPRCNAVLSYKYQGYCDACGQMLKWAASTH